MPRCSAMGCTSPGGHRYPSDPALRRIWILKVGKKSRRQPDKMWEPSSNSVLCHAHFTQDCFQQKNIYGDIPAKRLLKKDAVPTIFAQNSKAATSSSPHDEGVGNLEMAAELCTTDPQFGVQRAMQDVDQDIKVPSAFAIPSDDEFTTSAVGVVKTEKGESDNGYPQPVNDINVYHVYKRIKLEPGSHDADDHSVCDSHGDSIVNFESSRRELGESSNSGHQESSNADRNRPNSCLRKHCDSNDHENELSKTKHCESDLEHDSCNFENTESSPKRYESKLCGEISMTKHGFEHHGASCPAKRQKLSTPTCTPRNQLIVTECKDLVCKICNVTFTEEGSLAKHMRSAHYGTALLCLICQEAFIDEKNLDLHLDFHRKKEQQLCCHLCGDFFHRYGKIHDHMNDHLCKVDKDVPSYLLDHVRVPISSLGYTCNICGVVELIMAAIETHLLAHKNPQYSCQVCGKEYASIKDVKEFSCRSHGVNCSECDMEFHSQYEFKKHLESHFGVMHPCSICQQNFTERFNVNKHFRAVHQNEAGHPCPICGELFELRFTLMKHLNLHKGSKECVPNHLNERIKVRAGEDNSYLYVCNTCGATSSSYALLIPHLVEHTKNVVSCVFCGMEFVSDDELLIHGRSHGDKCSLCGRDFRSNEEFTRHMESHYGPIHTCVICEQGFSMEENLSKHMRSCHDGRDRHLCHICEESFSSVQDIQAHLVTHRGTVELVVPNDIAKRVKTHNNKYACNICGMPYATLATVTAHLVKHRRSLNNDCQNRACAKCGKEFISPGCNPGHISHHYKLLHPEPRPAKIRGKRKKKKA